jgi:hypothetical protein
MICGNRKPVCSAKNWIWEQDMPEDFQLFQKLQEVADEISDGHLTILKFTTNWRIGFETPTGREDIDVMASGSSFAGAARRALEQAGHE